MIFCKNSLILYWKSSGHEKDPNFCRFLEILEAFLDSLNSWKKFLSGREREREDETFEVEKVIFEIVKEVKRRISEEGKRLKLSSGA